MGYFATVYSLLAPSFEVVMGPLRKRQSAAAFGQTLVIGAGTGLDVATLFEQGIAPDLLEPDPTLAAGLRRRYPDLRVWESVAENIPVPDGRYDTVVATLVLCSVSRPRDVLREVERVLRPGGRFLFTEHVGHEQGHIGRYLQNGLEPVWRPLAGGCRLTRHPADYVDATELVIDHVDPVRRGLLLPIVQGAFYKTSSPSP
jgi:SAM-dependent methyltransferase